MEKARSNQWAENMCTLSTVTTLDQGDGDEEYTDFWEYLGLGTIAPDMDDDEEIAEFSPLLFRVDGDMSANLEQVAVGSPVKKTSKVCTCLQRSALEESDVFLLDSGWEIFVWIGKGGDRYEKIAAMSAADRYSKTSPRTVNLPVHIIKDGNETEKFNSYFE
jgi:hypothetical protein